MPSMFQDWEEVSGSVLEETYEVGRSVRVGRDRVWFEGVDRSTGQAVSIQAFRSEDNAELRRILNRFQEASFLEHPNLLRIIHAVPVEDAVFVVSERGEYDLPQFIEQRPMPVEDARELTQQLVGALKGLHAENLIYCNLSVDSVWKIGNEWKLSDFSQLRVAGNADGETRRILSRLQSVPPEVFEGVISPAWDVWSLGTLLQRVLTPAPTHVDGAVSIPRGRQLRLHGLPEPFDKIARDCLKPAMQERLTLPQIEERLSSPVVAEPAEAPPVARQQTYLIEDPPPSNMRIWLALALGILVVLVAMWLFGEQKKSGAGGESARTRTNEAPATFGNAPATKLNPAPIEIPPVQHTNAPPRDASIPKLIEQWAQATRNKDAAGSASFYAPRVKQFFGRKNVTPDEIRRDREQVYKVIGNIHRFEISNMEVKQTGSSSAVASFDKTWQFGSGKLGKVREQLSFGRYGGGWKITSEKETRTYR